MRIVHWTMFNSSGMNQVAETMCAAERAIGLDSHLADAFNTPRDELISKFRDADIHLAHTYIPTWFLKLAKPTHKMVWIGHGTPEHVFMNTAIDVASGNYGCNDGLMLYQYYLQHADAVITHWPRHAAILRTLVDRRTPVHLVHMGVDTDFWKPVPSSGAYAGEPSLFSAENCHYIKWPYDLFITWSLTYMRLKTEGCLHVLGLPLDQHRYFFPLVNRNGASYASHISATRLSSTNLRNAFVSTNFFIGLVQKGDFNRLSCEAAACGAKLITYRGNPYAHYWLTEGDQRTISDELVTILEGNVEPRTPEKITSSLDAAREMRHIYETI